MVRARARPKARPSAGPATAELMRRHGSSRAQPRGPPATRPGGRRALPRELVRSSSAQPARKSRRSLVEKAGAACCLTGTACCLTDTHGRHGPLWRTTDWGCLRFYHGRGKPPSCYGRAALDTWAGRAAELWPRTAEVFAYFNNEGYRCAPRHAHRLGLALGKHAFLTTRLPAAGKAPLTSG
jgi:hypothetical protein